MKGVRWSFFRLSSFHPLLALLSTTLIFSINKSQVSGNPSVHTCLKGYFACDAERCIEEFRICDSYVDCTDQRDEEGCACLRIGWHLCTTSRNCYSPDEQCDGKKHCEDGSDESSCTHLTTTITTTTSTTTTPTTTTAITTTTAPTTTTAITTTTTPSTTPSPSTTTSTTTSTPATSTTTTTSTASPSTTTSTTTSTPATSTTTTTSTPSPSTITSTTTSKPVSTTNIQVSPKINSSLTTSPSSTILPSTTHHQTSTSGILLTSDIHDTDSISPINITEDKKPFVTRSSPRYTNSVPMSPSTQQPTKIPSKLPTKTTQARRASTPYITPKLTTHQPLKSIVLTPSNFRKSLYNSSGSQSKTSYKFPLNTQRQRTYTSRPLLNCSEDGTAQAHNWRSHRYCPCKKNVEGRLCDKCREQTFNLNKGNRLGCLTCFCMNTSRTCTSSTRSREKIKIKRLHCERDVDRTKKKKTKKVSCTFPDQFLGDQILSYGGRLKFRTVDLKIKSKIKLFIKDSKTTLRHTVKSKKKRKRIVIKLKEKNFEIRSNDASPDVKFRNPTRPEFMVVLADMASIYLTATAKNKTKKNVTLRSISMESAAQNGTGKIAAEVEECSCPYGYTGSSCQLCAAGFRKIKIKRSNPEDILFTCQKEKGAKVGYDYNNSIVNLVSIVNISGQGEHKGVYTFLRNELFDKQRQPKKIRHDPAFSITSLKPYN